MKQKRKRKAPASPYHATEYSRNSGHKISKKKREKDQLWKEGVELKGSLGDRIKIENGKVILSESPEQMDKEKAQWENTFLPYRRDWSLWKGKRKKGETL